MMCLNTQKCFNVIILNVDAWRITRNYSHNHTAFVEAFKKEFAKHFFKSMDDQKIQDHNKVSTKKHRWMARS